MSHPMLVKRAKRTFKARGHSGNLVAKKATDEYGDSRGRHVKLYATEVVSLSPSGEVTLRNGGYKTNTTMRRINEVSDKWGLGFRVQGSRKGWIVKLPSRLVIPFTDGMTFDPKAQEFGELPQLGYPKGFKRNPRKDGGVRWGGVHDADVRRIAHKHGWEVISVGPFNEGGGGIAPNCIVLWKVGGYQPYATHYINLQDGGAYWGHYHETLDAAKREFTERIRVNTPGEALGVMRRNPDAKGRKMINLQEKRGSQWITLAMFRLDQKDFAKQVAKRFHRKFPQKALRLFS